jgi:PleD family two-component response regulator
MSRPDVMIIDTDRNRIRSLRRILREARGSLTVEEVTQPQQVRAAVAKERPTLVLMHSTFPYLEEDGTGLLELVQEDMRNVNTGIMLVLPVSGSMLYRSGYQDGMEMLELADDLITTDFTSDMIQNMVIDYIDRRAAVRQEARAAAGEPAYAFIPE